MNQTLIELKLNKQTLAAILGVSPKKANDLIIGRREVSEDQAKLLAAHFNLPISHFLEFVEDLV
jgi:plasmid maintenance system antidote protein VapI